MSTTVLILAMIGAGAALAILLVLLLLRVRGRPRVMAAAPREAVPLSVLPPPAPPESPPPTSMTMAAADSVLRAMAARGETVQAIKMVREMTGLGLKEAKDYVDALPNVPPIMVVARQRQMAAGSAAGAGASASVRSEAATLVARGQSIEAMKLVRERTGMGLREAQEYVEGLVRAQKATPADRRGQLQDPRLRQAVAQLLAAGQADQAMKLIQSVSGVSIEAAKHYMDQVRQGG